MAATLQFIGLRGVSSPSLAPSHCCSISKKQICSVHLPRQQRRSLCARAVETDATSGEPAAATAAPEEPPSIDFAFVSPRLLPDGTPDVHYRTACGGQKLRDIMLQGFIDLYGPYDKLLLNCSGGGVCGTCIVEVVEGKELLSPKTEIEKEKLKRAPTDLRCGIEKPKMWRLACQATVGKTQIQQDRWSFNNCQSGRYTSGRSNQSPCGDYTVDFITMGDKRRSA